MTFWKLFPGKWRFAHMSLNFFKSISFQRASRSLAKTGFFGPLLDTLFIANPSLSLKREFFTYGIYRV